MHCNNLWNIDISEKGKFPFSLWNPSTSLPPTPHPPFFHQIFVLSYHHFYFRLSVQPQTSFLLLNTLEVGLGKVPLPNGGFRKLTEVSVNEK